MEKVELSIKSTGMEDEAEIVIKGTNASALDALAVLVKYMEEVTTISKEDILLAVHNGLNSTKQKPDLKLDENIDRILDEIIKKILK